MAPIGCPDSVAVSDRDHNGSMTRPSFGRLLPIMALVAAAGACGSSTRAETGSVGTLDGAPIAASTSRASTTSSRGTDENPTSSTSLGNGDTASSTQGPISAPTGPPALRQIAQLPEPIDVQPRQGDDRLFVAERRGIIRALVNDTVDPEPWLDITALLTAGGERGLLAFTFAPQGDAVYVHYSDLDGNTQIDRWDVDASGNAVPDSRSAILSAKQPHSNHNGGRIAFGPDDMLYIGLGDGGSQGDPDNRAQNLNDVLGKILRIDPSGDGPYAIPADNPFVGQDARPEVWSYGLRNPWRFSWDRTTGELWIGDVGQNQWEEVNRSASGRGVNYGWRAYEGNASYNDDTNADGAEPPAFEYSHDGDGGCSVTGGVVYRGNALPSLQGQYLFGDYCWSTLRAFSDNTIVDLGLAVGNVVSINEDNDGEVYVVGFDGSLSKLVPAT
jgi:glucose/arabinose dehydrogenase